MQSNMIRVTVPPAIEQSRFTGWDTNYAQNYPTPAPGNHATPVAPSGSDDYGSYHHSIWGAGPASPATQQGLTAYNTYLKPSGPLPQTSFYESFGPITVQMGNPGTVTAVPGTSKSYTVSSAYSNLANTSDSSYNFNSWTGGPGSFVPYKADMGLNFSVRTREEKAAGYDTLVPHLYQQYVNYQISDSQLFSQGNSYIAQNDRDSLKGYKPINVFSNMMFNDSYNGIFNFNMRF